MLTGLYAVRNLLLGDNYDLWSVNAEQDYHEEQEDGDDGNASSRSVGRNRVISALPSQPVADEPVAVQDGETV